MGYAKRRDSSNESGESDKPRQSARSYLLWLLSKREYSASELQKKLKFKGYEEQEIAEALAFAQSHNFQSDERFARIKVQSNVARQGNRGLSQKLREKGITSEVISEQLENLEPEEERAIRVVERFKGKPLTTQLYGKVQRFLVYRGFSSRSMKAAISYLREHEGEASEDTSDFDEALESLD
jgi:regulatory protein